MSRSEVFVDSSVFVGLHLGDPRAFTLAIQDGLKGAYDSDFERIPFLKTFEG
ncbi:hypothetical protein [Thermococcus celericrescens]|uniref:hypothetical protein n=1 Tax=Thermococcus celericrescens TaxID=227598 RepID=UPI000AB969D0|nr:hypothetical protein [Thermococcus celericrescens]